MRTNIISKGVRPYLERSDHGSCQSSVSRLRRVTAHRHTSSLICGVKVYRSTEISEVYPRAFLESWTSRLQDTPILNNRIMGTSVLLGCHRRGRGCTEVPKFPKFILGRSWNPELQDFKIHLFWTIEKWVLRYSLVAFDGEGGVPKYRNFRSIS